MTITAIVTCGMPSSGSLFLQWKVFDITIQQSGHRLYCQIYNQTEMNSDSESTRLMSHFAQLKNSS